MVSEQVVRYVPKGEDAAEFTSVGKPVQYCEVRIADKDGKPLPADRVGVVEIRGDNVISD